MGDLLTSPEEQLLGSILPIRESVWGTVMGAIFIERT